MKTEKRTQVRKKAQSSSAIRTGQGFGTVVQGKGSGRAIVSPASKDGFPIHQSTVDELSKGTNLAAKSYGGVVSGWPNNMNGAEVIQFWIDKAANADAGYDMRHGYQYAQLISKFLMGAVFYNQAVDKYLDEYMSAEKKPNDKPYKGGAPYTGKEHSWDEAFGYFGAAADFNMYSDADIKAGVSLSLIHI